MKQWLNLYLDDVLLVIGAVLIVRGVMLFSIPAAWIAAGIAIIIFAYLRENEKAQNAITEKFAEEPKD